MAANLASCLLGLTNDLKYTTMEWRQSPSDREHLGATSLVGWANRGGRNGKHIA
jgi:hypothetical protein